MRVLPCGPHALLVEVATGEERADLVRRLAHRPLAGVTETLPAARTVLLLLDRDTDPAAVVRALESLPEAPPSAETADDVVTIEVTYDGPDLADVARHLDISREEVVRRHTAQTWTCEFVGFLPGFGYLAGSEGGLDVPRRDSPRARIPAGSVALAAGLSAVYPSSSPGGWQLIGRTAERMFEVDREPPGLLRAGTRVQFVETTARGFDTARPGGLAYSTSVSGLAYSTSGDLTVERVSTLALVEDLGRPGHRHLGVPPSGAADRISLARGNRLLGNAAGAAGIEVLMGGLGVRATAPVLVAVTGAAAPVRVDGAPAPFGAPIGLGAGQLLEVGTATTGLRCYVAVRGGIHESNHVPRVLGSLSSDPTSALGPEPLQAGVALAVGSTADEPHVGLSIPPVSDPRTGFLLHATWGPRADWLTDAARASLRSSSWSVSTQTDRVGVRLDGPPVPLSRSDQLPSEGLVRGCVQVPPDGTPIVFLADHPTTGGYPVVAVVDDADTDLLAQAPPGTPVRLQVR
jgi:KipI family sensor histidine kinase inhibitor